MKPTAKYPSQAKQIEAAERRILDAAWAFLREQHRQIVHEVSDEDFGTARDEGDERPAIHRIRAITTETAVGLGNTLDMEEDDALVLANLLVDLFED